MKSASEFANQVVDRCDSTNDLARLLGEEGHPHGTWVSTRVQEKGRGRLGREWQSLEGNLFLSILVRPPEKTLWTWIPMATAIAVVEAVRDLFPELSANVKWPNDLWIDRKKLGGILCEAVGGRGESFVVIGIGLNCVDAPKALDQPTISLSEKLGRKITADEVREKIVSRVLSWMNLDAARVAQAYAKLAAFPPGTVIQWADGAQTGSVVELGPVGELRVKNSAGETISLYAEDVKIRAAPVA
jgi:BirA family biotin operon repressor/biotin-[acetyl-CoA-carboxylase] ligase